MWVMQRPSGLCITHISQGFWCILSWYEPRTYAFILGMNSSIVGCEQWSQQEFSLAQLGDARRTQRLVQVASALAQCPSGTLPEAFCQWNELKAAYRLFSNPTMSYESIIRPHWERTRQSCRQPGEYLIIEDSSCLDFSAHRQTTGLGRIGNDRGLGLMLHSALAVRVEGWMLDQTPEVSLGGLR